MIHFQNADVCPRARVAFEGTVLNATDQVELIKAARFIDSALGILKTAYAAGYLTSGAYDDFLSYVSEASEILEELGILEDHDYIQDDMEARAIELLDVDSVIIGDDDDPELDAFDRAIFGDD